MRTLRSPRTTLAATGSDHMEKGLSMRRRVADACAGGLLAVGAPIGLLGVRAACRPRRDRSNPRDGAPLELASGRPDYLYVWMSTTVAFMLFGYVLGRQADALAELSVTDPLTGLSNARGLFQRLDAELARWRRYRESLALLALDLDGLKIINDRYGHRTGDDAIRTVAQVIRSELRETDTGARWAGDEFAVLAPRTSAVAALALAERIRALVARQQTRWPLHVSVGVATLDANAADDACDSASLMRVADTALYAAKRGGRNRVAIDAAGAVPKQVS